MSSTNNIEFEKENSLTAPVDRDRENKWKPDQSLPPLTNTEAQYAMEALNNRNFVEKFPKVDKTYADPALPMQLYGLISFTPAKGATPNENGVYGFAKLRGNFGTDIEANQRAEFLIRNYDSYHQIYHTYVGRPFPITVSSKYSAETSEVDIRKETSKTISQNIRDKKDEEEKAMREIKQREEKLLEETRRDEIDPYDEYITLRVKLAQLSWTYLEHQKKMAEVKEIVIKTRRDVKKLDEEYPTFIDSYFEKYMKARRDAGLEESKMDLEANFVKYMVEDAPLDF
jgi:hypothetical protein